MMHNLLVIFGAGASYDYSEFSAPCPLTNELVNSNRMDQNLLLKYKDCGDLFTEIRPNIIQKRISFENALRELKEKFGNQKHRKIQFAALAYYLKDFFKNASGHTSTINNYANLINKLKDHNSGTATIATFNYDSDIRRDGGIIGMIITGLENLSESKIAKIIMAPEIFIAALVPSKKTAELADSLISNRKQYDVLINDNIKEMNFKLNEHFPEDRLGNALRAIIGAFPDAQIYIIDDNSNLYSSKAYSFIKKELAKRNIEIVLESSIAHLRSGSDQQIENSFRSIAHQSDGGKQIFMEVPADYYFTIKPDVSALIKIGYKFISFIRPPQ